MEDDTRLLLRSIVLRHRKKKWMSTAALTVTVLLASVVLLGTAFVGGLFAGRKVMSASSDGNGEQSSSQPARLGHTHTHSSSQWSCSWSRPAPDWGRYVNVGGKNESVTEWLDGELQPMNIKNNLR